MNIFYDVKWKNDLKTYLGTFRSFIMEGNVNDLQAVEDGEKYKYLPLHEAIAEEYGKDYCVVFYDHTKRSGKPIKKENADKESHSSDWDDDADGGETDAENEGQTIDADYFNSFTFYKKTAYSATGERVQSPNVSLFAEYYREEYLDKIAESSNKDMQGAKTIDIRRILDVMTDFDEKKKQEQYADAKPFMFVLPDVSRYMTTPGNPDDRENAILMILFNATQIEKTSCKLVICVDKINDLPTWFESENNNSAVKKLYIPTPDAKFRETFYRLEMRDIMEPVSDEELDDKIKKFSAYTEKYSLRRLKQLKNFIETESEKEDNSFNLKKIENIDRTVLKFDSGQTKDPWREKDLKHRIGSMGGKITKEIQGQNTAVFRVCEALKAAVVGVNTAKKNDRRPRAIFFFAGPTGTGKTELTKQITESIFQKQDSMIRFDMSEFREEHSDARLFGAPPGYVGYEAGGELTKAVKQNPFSIILFDEIEKASPRIWDKFLQILGDGRLTDGKGETVSFTQSIIVFTSNLGITADPVSDGQRHRESVALNAAAISRTIAGVRSASDEAEKKKIVDDLVGLYRQKACLVGLTSDMKDDYLFTDCYKELGAADATEAFNNFVSALVKDRIEGYFNNIGRREVLGRIGEENILVFNFISPQIAVKIADGTINKFVKYLKEEHDSELDLEVTEAAREFIRKKAQESDTLNLGGRGIVSCVEKLISVPVGDFLFEEEGRKLSAVMDVAYGRLTVGLK